MPLNNSLGHNNITWYHDLVQNRYRHNELHFRRAESNIWVFTIDLSFKYGQKLLTCNTVPHSGWKMLDQHSSLTLWLLGFPSFFRMNLVMPVIHILLISLLEADTQTGLICRQSILWIFSGIYFLLDRSLRFPNWRRYRNEIQGNSGGIAKTKLKAWITEAGYT